MNRIRGLLAFDSSRICRICGHDAARQAIVAGDIHQASMPERAALTLFNASCD